MITELHKTISPLTARLAKYEDQDVNVMSRRNLGQSTSSGIGMSNYQGRYISELAKKCAPQYMAIRVASKLVASSEINCK